MSVVIAIALAWAAGAAFMLGWAFGIRRCDPQALEGVVSAVFACLVAFLWPLAVAWVLAIMLVETARHLRRQA